MAILLHFIDPEIRRLMGIDDDHLFIPDKDPDENKEDENEEDPE